jgi:histidinol dehydrogenase
MSEYIGIYYTKNGGAKDFLDLLQSRAGQVNQKVEETVRAIIEDVRQNGDAAVQKYTEEIDVKLFGKTPPKYFQVPEEAFKTAMQNADPDFLTAMQHAIQNIAEYHARQQQNGYMMAEKDGVIIGQKVRGLDRVGIYVPGGTAALPSTLMMDAIPATIAGVGELICVTPPDANGEADPSVLVAAAMNGVDKVFVCGGAQAVAALAFGTQTIPKVSKIVGPGNIYVTTAKKLLYGTVDIEMTAGPSEILILADDTANPAYIAADLCSQAEHDLLAGAILVTDSERIANETAEALKNIIPTLSRAEIIKQSLNNFGGIIVAQTIDEAVKIAETIAPEHMEILAVNPLEYIGKVDNVGSLFLGEYSPEALGDYFAGPNHVLPTSGTARFFSPLSVDSFYKKSSYIYYTKNALCKAAKDVVTIANKEGLSAHARSVTIRTEGEESV